MDSHGFFLRSQGGDEQIVLALARADLAAAPVTDADVENLRRHGWTDPQIAEAVYITAMFAFFNRVADAFGIDRQGYGGPRPDFSSPAAGRGE